MTLDEAIERYTSNAEYERADGSLQGCLEFKQLAEWLKELKRVKEQEPILDKIKSEIEQLTSRYSISKERGGMGQVEWSDRLIKESDVLQIIDKYREEADCRECKAEYECYECEKYEESEVKNAIC